MSRIVLRLAADVEGVAGVHLHAIGQLERLDARFQLRVVVAAPLVALVELLQQVELPALLGLRRVTSLRMFSISLSISVCCVSM